MGKKTRKSPQVKQQILEEANAIGMIETARKHQISYQTLKNWQDAFEVRGVDGLKAGGGQLSPEMKRLQLENQRLKELVADKELELKIKNELLKKTMLNKAIGR
jgi:putative transposase